MRPLFLALGLLFLLPLARARADGPLDLETADGIRPALSDREAGTRLLAARAAADVPDARLTAPLVRLLKDDEAEIRSAAIEALRRREGKERAAAARGLAGRLPTYLQEGADADEHALVVQALHDLAQPVSIKALLDVPVTTDRAVVKQRALAVANVPDAAAIEALLQLGSRGRRGAGFGAVAREALVYATGQDFRADPDVWRRWWREAKKDFDFEAAHAARDEARRAKAEKEAARRARREKRREREDAEPAPEPPDGSGITEPV